jgi:protein-S-isoprenylcysteine O-methyltransferase Ste14
MLWSVRNKPYGEVSMRALYLLFAGVAYAIFFATFLYLIAFVGDLPFVPVTVDQGIASGAAVALIVDLALIALFGVQHSVMARRGFKEAWTRIVPVALERSVYVLAASIVLIILFALWHPIAGDVWRITDPAGTAILWALFAAGWAIVLLSTFLINHFELFGLTQVYRHWRGKSAVDPRFRRPLFYKLVRHPLYSGFLLSFWATPVMTVGHALLAAGMTVYVMIAIRYEERDLVALFGPEYEAYQADTGMLVPGVGRR